MTKQDTTDFIQVDPRKFTDAPLRAERTFTLNAPPEKVWALISDHEKVPTYLSMVEKVTVDNSHAVTLSGVGAVRTCTISGMAFEEEMRLWEPNRALVYSLHEGNPVGMTGHLAVALLAPNKTGGTTVRWQFHFNHPDADTMATQSAAALQQAVSGLIEVFGGAESV